MTSSVGTIVWFVLICAVVTLIFLPINGCYIFEFVQHRQEKILVKRRNDLTFHQICFLILYQLFIVIDCIFAVSNIPNSSGFAAFQTCWIWFREMISLGILWTSFVRYWHLWYDMNYIIASATQEWYKIIQKDNKDVNKSKNNSNNNSSNNNNNNNNSTTSKRNRIRINGPDGTNSKARQSASSTIGTETTGRSSLNSTNTNATDRHNSTGGSRTRSSRHRRRNTNSHSSRMNNNNNNNSRNRRNNRNDESSMDSAYDSTTGNQTSDGDHYQLDIVQSDYNEMTSGESRNSKLKRNDNSLQWFIEHKSTLGNSNYSKKFSYGIIIFIPLLFCILDFSVTGIKDLSENDFETGLYSTIVIFYLIPLGLLLYLYVEICTKLKFEDVYYVGLELKYLFWMIVFIQTLSFTTKLFTDARITKLDIYGSDGWVYFGIVYTIGSFVHFAMVWFLTKWVLNRSGIESDAMIQV